MNEWINFKGEDSSEYSVKVSDGTIDMRWYHLGSIYGGTGTEGSILIGIENIAKFLDEMKFKNLEEFVSGIEKYQCEEWSFLKQEMLKFCTYSYSWDETNWED